MPEITLPENACDAHLHVLGAPDRYPGAPSRQYQPREKRFDEYRTLASSLGLSRAVLVQPSCYGTDNRAMLDTLREHPGATRGIAVIDPAVADRDLEEMHALGVRGVRLNLMNPRVSSPEAARSLIAPVVRKVARLGWHLQIYADPDVVAPIAPVLASCGVPVVLDHCAGARASRGVGDRDFAALVELYAQGRCWVKISGADIVSGQGTNASPVADAGLATAAPFVRALVAAGTTRLVWGSDWPHLFHFHGPAGEAAPATIFRPVDERALLRIVLECTNPADRRRVFVDNPAALYDFRE
ncbi:MAG: amidohydrolase family protein [Burkholderiales bacterium]